MMSPLYKLLIPLTIILGLAVVVVYFDKNQLLPAPETTVHDDSDDDESPASIMTGQMTVHMPENIQQDANLQLVRLARAESVSEIHAYAQVADIQSLVELVSRYREALTEKSMTENALKIAGQDLERLKTLHREASNISERELQQSQLQWMTTQSQYESIRVKLDNIRNQLLQGWGPVLTEEAMNNSQLAQDLLQRRSLLLLVTLEGKQLLPDNTSTILINVQGSREQSRVAHYISPAAFTGSQIYGQTYFFHTPATDLRPGLFLDAWVPEGDNTRQGVLMPSASVVWYADKPWVYIKTSADTFARRELKEYTVTRDGWFVRKDFMPGDEVVLHGGQMLLSQEFRWSIPDEDDDP